MSICEKAVGGGESIAKPSWQMRAICAGSVGAVSAMMSALSSLDRICLLPKP